MFLYNYDSNEMVAHHLTSTHPENSGFHHSVTLMHTEKVNVDEKFTFCWMFYDSSPEMKIEPNGFEWSYKILGSEYTLKESPFTESDFTKVTREINYP